MRRERSGLAVPPFRGGEEHGVTRSPVTKASVLLVFTSFIFGKYGNVTDVRFLLLPRLVPLHCRMLSVSADLRHVWRIDIITTRVSKDWNRLEAATRKSNDDTTKKCLIRIYNIAWNVKYSREEISSNNCDLVFYDQILLFIIL